MKAPVSWLEDVRIMHWNDNKAKDKILKTDKKRASYYNYYTNKRWSDVESYELCLSSSQLGIEGTAQMIEQYIALKESTSAQQVRL